jgi:hypothetical protein
MHITFKLHWVLSAHFMVSCISSMQAVYCPCQTFMRHLLMGIHFDCKKVKLFLYLSTLRLKDTGV